MQKRKLRKGSGEMTAFSVVHPGTELGRRFRHPSQLRFKIPRISTTLGELDATQTLRTLWSEVPAFRYVESDDWDLASRELRESVLELLNQHPELLRKILIAWIEDTSIPLPRRKQIADEMVQILEDSVKNNASESGVLETSS